MEILYTFTKNTTIENNIIRIEAAKRIITFLPQLPNVEEFLRKKSLLKSSLFSAQIEGNTLRIEEIERQKAYRNITQEKQEVFNILRALEWIHIDNHPKLITPEILLFIHKMVMQDISIDAGKFRTEPSAIFNQAGLAIYMTPPPSKISQLLMELISLSKREEHPALVAAISHFAFEKIHPFLDGNGRVGRLFATLLLKNAGYSFRGLAVFEEYIQENREEYYDTLNLSSNDITDFVVFFTTALAVSAEKVIDQLQKQKEENPEDTLLPRRQEILAIIREHEFVSFDFIKRRFTKVPESSLHYDLKMLLKKGFIQKLGATRGVFYRSR